MMEIRLHAMLIHPTVDCNDFELVFGSPLMIGTFHYNQWRSVHLLGLSTLPWFGRSNPNVGHLHVRLLSLRALHFDMLRLFLCVFFAVTVLWFRS